MLLERAQSRNSSEVFDVEEMRIKDQKSEHGVFLAIMEALLYLIRFHILSPLVKWGIQSK